MKAAVGDRDLSNTLKVIFRKRMMKIKEGELKILAYNCVQMKCVETFIKLKGVKLLKIK